MCIDMPTAVECLCCLGVDNVKERVKTAQLKCITQHEGFIGNCLNIYVLEASYYEFIQEEGPFGDDEDSHE